jgi:hypothetical protein
MSLTITLSGPRTSEQQARNALVAEQFDMSPPDHDYGLPAVSDQQAEAFITVIGDDVDKAWDAVRALGWQLRIHHETPEPARPGPEQQLADTFAEYGRRLAALEAVSARPPIRGGAVESPGWASQNSTFGAEQTRRAVGALLQRGANIGTPVGGLVAAGDLAITAPGSGMSCNVAPGEAYVAGTSAATQGAYYGRVSSTTNLAIAASDPSNPRVDRVSFVEVDKAYAGSVDSLSLAVETGTPNAAATLALASTYAAAAPASSLTDGYVLVPATATNIVSGDIANVASTVIGLGGCQFGLLASRPAATAVPKGASYYATDTALFYESNGTVWLTVMLAGPWTALTLASGIAAVSNEYTPSARLEGDVVRLKGELFNASTALSAGAAWATIPASPAGMRPSATGGSASGLVLGVSYTGSPAATSISITPSGVISLQASSTNGTIVLDDTTFTVS